MTTNNRPPRLGALRERIALCIAPWIACEADEALAVFEEVLKEYDLADTQLDQNFGPASADEKENARRQERVWRARFANAIGRTMVTP